MAAAFAHVPEALPHSLQMLFHTGKAATLIAFFLCLLQAFGAVAPPSRAAGLHEAWWLLRTTAAMGWFSQAMCFTGFISNITSNQTAFSPELAEVLIEYQ